MRYAWVGEMTTLGSEPRASWGMCTPRSQVRPAWMLGSLLGASVASYSFFQTPTVHLSWVGSNLPQDV